MSAVALIVAAGRGTRFGGEVPKQYVPVAGVCAFRRSVERFLAQSGVTHVQPVIHADDCGMFADAMAGLEDGRLLPAVTGGETRAQSVLRGLEAVAGTAPQYVLIHDAARPFVSDRIIGEVLAGLANHAGAFAALPVVDALWREDNGLASAPVARDGLWRAQTPQGFRFAPLLTAHQGHQGDAADDVAIARAAGMDVRIVRGDEDNFKITTPEDLARAERVASAV